MQASETVFKGMQDFAEGPIGEGPPVEDRGIYFEGDPLTTRNIYRLFNFLLDWPCIFSLVVSSILRCHLGQSGHIRVLVDLLMFPVALQA